MGKVEFDIIIITEPIALDMKRVNFCNYISKVFYVASLEGISPGVQMAFASILGQTPQGPSSEEEEEEEGEDDEEDDDNDEEEEEDDTLSYVDDTKDEDYKVAQEAKEDNVDIAEEIKLKKKGTRGRRRDRRKRMLEDDDEDNPSAGDVFALEMELNRENKKMMKVRICQEYVIADLFVRFYLQCFCVALGAA